MDDPLAADSSICRAIEEQGDRFEVNDIRYGVLWDFDHDVRNAQDREVMGVTEYHDATPLHVLVSINGPRLRSLDTLLRSTVAHELGHVVFDAPAWLVGRQRPSCRRPPISTRRLRRSGIPWKCAPTSSWAHCSFRHHSSGSTGCVS